MFRPSSRKPTGSEVHINKRHKGIHGISARCPFRLNFYDQPPSLDVTLEEFETCAIARLRVLSHIENLSHRSLPAAQFATAIISYSKVHIPLSSNSAKNADVEKERRRDEIGHWVLRLAFCRSPDLRQRFVRSEVALFKSRFETDDTTERSEFLKSLSFGYDQVTDAEKIQYKESFRKFVPPKTKEDAFLSETWYKVPWFSVPDLVSARRVYIKDGSAYVPQSLQLSLILQIFAERLEKALEFTAKNLPRLDEDERLGPVIDHLASSFLSGIGDAEYQPASGAESITAQTVHNVARKHFPPCMRHLYEDLMKERHLKHWGRLQLNLFLKGLGLPLEEAIVFWRQAFSPKISEDKFNKEYKYNIRHGYGQEGRRANYPPKNCQQILTQNQPSTQDNHGCPFRHFAPEKLVEFLDAHYGIARTSPDIRDIMDLVKNAHYHVACTRVFEVTHGMRKGDGLRAGETVSHPNKYADRSRELERETGEEVKDEGMVID
ncbi:uncharacterized protein L203_104567 [Cryptococcus depauperatus CBS 7841]|uniref:DNA primase large subunit n=1 Tax=Cryptococcus depauperatus CBS 7841 TaxID=1295531 RepID=A0AAJ8JVY2_9TREE